MIETCVCVCLISTKRVPMLLVIRSYLSSKFWGKRHHSLFKVHFHLLSFYLCSSLGFQQQMSSETHSIGPLLNMDRVRTILTHPYPYQLEHSKHAIIAVICGWLFFISSDNLHTIIQKLDKNFKWWSMYICLFGFFYFFSSPFMRQPIKPSYSNFSRW